MESNLSGELHVSPSTSAICPKSRKPANNYWGRGKGLQKCLPNGKNSGMIEKEGGKTLRKQQS